MKSIRSLFAKPIERKIEEVIKVDQADEQTVLSELEEYIVTDSIKEHFSLVYDEIIQVSKNPREGIGVWVSGFFGSGKSSFAKILGYTVAGKPVCGKSASDIFKENVKELNTRLRVIAEQVFKKIAPESADDVAREVDKGLLSLEDLDKLSKNVEGLKTGTVKLIFGTASAVEVTLVFAASEEHDSDIQTKHAMTELTGLFRTQLGIDLGSGSKPAAARKKLWRILLAAEFLSSFPKEKRPDAFSSISIPEEPEKIERVKNICSNWRNRVDLRATYVQASQAVERELGLAKLVLPAEIINSSDTFSVLEKKLLLLAEQFILDGKPTEALSLAEKRKQSFWSLQEPTFQLRWTLVENSARILLVGEAIKKAIKTVPKNPESMVNLYAEIGEPWYFLDRYYRHLEMQYLSYDLELGSEYDRLEEMITRVRQSYTTTVQECIETFTNALESANFLVKDCLSQENIYSRYVAPYLSEGSKLAYFLVDALRYEMGKELVEGLTDGFEVELLPCVAQLPTITAIGMAALMPNAEKGMELVESAGGKTAVNLGSATLKDRTSRVKYFEESVGKNVASFKLNELIKPSKKMLAKIQEADVILVTSQEIDRWAEEAEDEQEARVFMQEVLDKLRKAIHRLASLGVRQFVVTADHGHLFGETIEGGMKMDPPGGKTIELHRRLWVGKGGKAAEGFLRISSSQIGLMGDLELAFPRSLACFKVKGGSTGYLHGGISLQEMVIPIITLKSKETKPISPETTLVTLAMEKPKITTRFFSITATYKIEGLFGPEEIRVSVVARGESPGCWVRSNGCLWL